MDVLVKTGNETMTGVLCPTFLSLLLFDAIHPPRLFRGFVYSSCFDSLFFLAFDAGCLATTVMQAQRSAVDVLAAHGCSDSHGCGRASSCLASIMVASSAVPVVRLVLVFVIRPIVTPIVTFEYFLPFFQEWAPDKIVSEAAYVLFYRRRRLTPSNVINMTI